MLADYRIFLVINIYSSWTCINAYSDSVSIFITGFIHDQQVCIRFISLSYSYLDKTLTYYILIIFIFDLNMVILLGLGFMSNDATMQQLVFRDQGLGLRIES